MILSQKTVNIIKSFSAINQGLLFKTGNQLKTVSAQKNILAQATIDENIENQFAVYDLNEFLNTLTKTSDEADTSNQQNFKVDDKFIVITSKQGKRKVSYGVSSESMIVTPPEREIKFPDPEVTVTVTKDTRDWITYQALNNRLNSLVIKSDGQNVYVVTSDITGAVIHSAEENIGDGNGDKYQFTFKLESLNIMEGDYDIGLSSQGVSHWKNKNIPVEYWITTEKGSFYQKA